MFKPELWQSHNEYRTIVNTYGRRLSRNNPKYSFDFYEEERQKLLNLNLDPLLEYIPPFYSSTGRPAENQAQILRSLILFVLLFNKTPAGTSLTLWVRVFFVKHFSLKKASEFPFFIQGISLLSAGTDGTHAYQSLCQTSALSAIFTV